MSRNRLGATGALQHEELGQDGDALEPDAEGPEHLAGRVLVGEQDSQHGGAAQQVLDAEGVLVRVVRGLVVVEHQVDDVGLRAGEEDLEGRVPERVRGVCPEEVWVGSLLVLMDYWCFAFQQRWKRAVALRIAVDC